MDIYYRVRDSEIYVVRDEKEDPLYILGVTWVGFEYRSHVVHGLHIRNWVEILQTIKSLGFNAIRLPFCANSVRPGVRPAPRVISYAYNRDLYGLDSISIMEK
ncbi:MAG: 1,4-beta-glucanase, partial [Ignisphaera sp.]